MRGTIRDRLSLNARAQLIGRVDELGALRQAFAAGAPIVVHLHGLPGIGKSAVAAAFVEEVRSNGATALTVECGAVEPTERGLLDELGRQLGCSGQREDVATALARRPSPALLVFDAYEVFGLLDAWMRQVLIPALPDRVLVLLASRLPPPDAWTEAPAWDPPGNVIGSVRALADDGRIAVIMVGSYFEPGSHQARVPARALSLVDGKITLQAETVEALNVRLR